MEKTFLVNKPTNVLSAKWNFDNDKAVGHRDLIRFLGSAAKTKPFFLLSLPSVSSIQLVQAESLD